MPSAVFMDGKPGRDDSWLVGEAAVNKAQREMERFDPTPKYRIPEESLFLGGYTVATNPVPAMTNLQLTLQFDRPMNTAVPPVITVSNLSGGLAPVIPAGGAWLTAFSRSISKADSRSSVVS